MRTKVRWLIVVLALGVVGAGSAWYLKVYRPSADVTPTETAQSFTDATALKGIEGNAADLTDVTIDADGTIHLAPSN